MIALAASTGGDPFHAGCGDHIGKLIFGFFTADHRHQFFVRIVLSDLSPDFGGFDVQHSDHLIDLLIVKIGNDVL